MKTIEQWFSEYDESHQNPSNKRVHWVCVPLILLSTVALFWLVRLPVLPAYLPELLHPWINAGVVLVIGALVFYFRLSKTIFAGMFLVAAVSLGICFLVDQVLQWPLIWIALAVFVAAWLGQFWGHKIEGKKPSFFKDLQFLFVGPAWVLAFVYRRYGIRI